MKTERQKYRVVFTFEARDEREAIQLISHPDLMPKDSEMRVVNVSRRLTVRDVLMVLPLAIAIVLIGYGFAEACWYWF